MIIGLATLVMMIFGSGSLEVFYMDKIEEGIDKQISDKGRKKELLADLKAYSQVAKMFNKSRNNHLKTLRKKNLYKSTSQNWYTEFFAERMIEREKLQAFFINQRILLQQKIDEDEWESIMKMAADETTKLAEQERKRVSKDRDKSIFRAQEKAVNEYLLNKEKKELVLIALSNYEKSYHLIVESYNNINVNETDFLENRNASEDEMLKLAENLNKHRADMYQRYMEYLKVLKKSTTDKEWKAIIKDFNNVLE